MHHIEPTLFCGFDALGDQQIHMARPAKALFDFFILKQQKANYLLICQKLNCQMTLVGMSYNFMQI